ncbi:MAG: hypothetical protein AAGE52_32965, partial [Myxococcota bacterium]
MWGALLFAVACSGSNADRTDAGDADAALGEPVERFAVVVAVRGTGVDSTSVVLVDDLGADTAIDLSESLVVPSLGSAFGSPFERDVLFAWSGDAPRLTRFRVRRDGSFVEEAELALDGRVLTPPRGVAVTDFMVVARDKAYLLDSASGAIIQWNPETMVMEARLDVPGDIEIPGPRLGPVTGDDQLLTDDELVFTVGFTNSREDNISSTSFVVFVDIANDEVRRVLTPDECGYLRHGRTTATGDFLFSTGVRSTAYEVSSAGRIGGPSCILRVAGDTFNAEVLAPPGALTEDRAAGSFIFVSDDSAFVRVLDETALPGEPTSLTRLELNNGQYWRWGFVRDFASGEFEVVAGSELRAGFAPSWEVAGRRYAVEYETDFIGSRILELQPSGALRPGLRTVHTVRNIFR